jgi:hypothetical protein
VVRDDCRVSDEMAQGVSDEMAQGVSDEMMMP